MPSTLSGQDRFFFESTLHRNWTLLDLARPPREKKLPVVLSRDEVHRILGCVRLPVYRACLITITPAGCGSSKAPGSPSPMSTVTACCSTSTARADRIATSLCPWIP